MIKFEAGKTGRIGLGKTTYESATTKAIEVEGEKTAVCCDTLTINGKSTSLSDEQFLSAVKKHMLSEIQSEAPEHKIRDLGRQIAMGEYEIGVSEIIKKIMLESEI